MMTASWRESPLRISEALNLKTSDVDLEQFGGGRSAKQMGQEPMGATAPDGASALAGLCASQA